VFFARASYDIPVEFAEAPHDAVATLLAPPSESTLLDGAAPATPTTEPAAQQQTADLNLIATQDRPPGQWPAPQAQSADRPPSSRTLPRRRWSRRPAVVIPAALLAVAVALCTVAQIARTHTLQQQRGNLVGFQTTSHAGSQVTLPFTGLRHPEGVAVDAAGNLYVVDYGNNRVVKLAAGSSIPAVLPFTGLTSPHGVAVDATGNLYVTDGSNRVVKLAAGSNTQTVLPFTGLISPIGVAVDAVGDLFVTDAFNDRVLKLAAGSNTQTVLPFTGLNWPNGVTVDAAGDLYTSDYSNNRMLKLAADSATAPAHRIPTIPVLSSSTTPTPLPNYVGFACPEGVAADAAGDVYVTDWSNNRVVKMAAGSYTQTVLPFTGLNHPSGVAVDAAGNVYVSDRGNDRVVKLSVG
jgi:serine/threonine protein kinase, bacterial